MGILSGKRVAILVDDFFEEAEFTGPLHDLEQAGAQVDIVAPRKGEIHGMHNMEIGKSFQATEALDDIRTDKYDALVLPGGTVNADSLRMNIQAKLWVRQFLKIGKPVAAICHAPWVVASADMVRGRQLTSYQTIQDDMRNAGGSWVDKEVVVDHSLITSRNPDDLPAFNHALIEMLQLA